MDRSERLPQSIASALGISERASLSRAPQGMTSQVVFVDDGTARLVLKRCRDARYVDWLRREHDVLLALAATSLPIPRVHAYHENVGNDGAVDAGLLMSRVPGDSLWDVLLQAPPARRSGLFGKLGEALSQLHATPVPEVLCNKTAWIDRALAQARVNLAWCDGSSELLAELEATHPAFVPEVLIHGDAALDNVLVDAEGSMQFIDWAGGGLGDPRYDIALALATEPELRLGASDRDAFYAGYGRPPLDEATLDWFVRLYEFF